MAQAVPTRTPTQGGGVGLALVTARVVLAEPLLAQPGLPLQAWPG